MNAGDEGVIQTNDDATICKRSAVRLGYWEDPYIELFTTGRATNRFDRKTPEINRGYYARVQAFGYLLDQCFDVLRLYNEQKKEQPGHQPLKCQIVNIGCGYDTLYWRLHRTADKRHLISSYVDLDLQSVTCKKLHTIRARSELLSVLGDDIRCNQSELHSTEYHLVVGDVRRPEQLRAKLFDDCHLDRNLPTIVISECVLVYLSRADTQRFLRWCTDSFTNCLVANYEQVNMFDKFGEVMVENLRQRNCEIMDLEACRDLQKQCVRFRECGFTVVNAWDMLSIYRNTLNAADRDRIESIEFLDEENLLEQLLSHYCIAVAYRGYEHLIGNNEEFGFD